MHTNNLLPYHTPPTGSKPPHPFILFVLFPLAFCSALYFLPHIVVFFIRLPQWTLWLCGIVIIIYILFYELRSRLQSATLTLVFHDKRLFHERFPEQMKQIGFTATQCTVEYYTFDIDPGVSLRYGIGSIIPRSWFRIEMNIRDTEADLRGARIVILPLKSLLQKRLPQEHRLLLPY
jgi:hypothetical protein